MLTVSPQTPPPRPPPAPDSAPRSPQLRCPPPPHPQTHPLPQTGPQSKSRIPTPTATSKRAAAAAPTSARRPRVAAALPSLLFAKPHTQIPAKPPQSASTAHPDSSVLPETPGPDHTPASHAGILPPLPPEGR